MRQQKRKASATDSTQGTDPDSPVRPPSPTPEESYNRWLKTKPPITASVSTGTQTDKNEEENADSETAGLTPALLGTHTSSWQQLTRLMKEHWTQNHTRPYVFSKSPYSIADLCALPAYEAREIAVAAIAYGERKATEQAEEEGQEEEEQEKIKKNDDAGTKKKKKKRTPLPDSPVQALEEPASTETSVTPSPLAMTGSPPPPTALTPPTPTPASRPRPTAQKTPWLPSSQGDPTVANRPECPLCKKQHMSHKQICKGGPPCSRCTQRGRTKEECMWSDQRPKGMGVKKERSGGERANGGSGSGEATRAEARRKMKKEGRDEKAIAERMAGRKRGIDGKFVV